jgi:hypothetical protein
MLQELTVRFNGVRTIRLAFHPSRQRLAILSGTMTA